MVFPGSMLFLRCLSNYLRRSGLRRLDLNQGKREGGRVRFLLDRTPGIFQHHSLGVRNRPGNSVVVDDLQEETDVRRHDAGGAGRREFEAVAFLLSRLDGALRGLAPDPVAIDDEARAVEVGKLGKSYLRALSVNTCLQRSACVPRLPSVRTPGPEPAAWWPSRTTWRRPPECDLQNSFFDLSRIETESRKRAANQAAPIFANLTRQVHHRIPVPSAAARWPVSG